MKSALIFSVRIQGSHQFGWKWRAADSSAESRRTFRYFYDCVQDGLRAGYQCRYEGVRSDAASRRTVPAPQSDGLGPRL